MAPTVTKPRKAVEIFSEQFRGEELARRADAGEDISVSELSKLASKKWREMSTEQKNKYNKMADKEKDIYGDGKEERKPRKSTKNKEEKENQDGAKSKPKKVKDPNAPKRNVTSFFVFSSKQRSIIKAENPSFKVTDVAKELGRRWKEMDAEEKREYEIEAEEDKQRYLGEVKAYEKKKESA